MGRAASSLLLEVGLTWLSPGTGINIDRLCTILKISSRQAHAQSSDKMTAVEGERMNLFVPSLARSSSGGVGRSAGVGATVEWCLRRCAFCTLDGADDIFTANTASDSYLIQAY